MTWGGKGLFQVTPTSAGTEAEADAEAMEECCFLACSHGWLCLLSYTIQDDLARDGTVRSGRTHYNNHQSKPYPTGLRRGQSYAGIFLKDSVFPEAPTCVKLM